MKSVQCAICAGYFSNLKMHLMKVHKMTETRYRQLYFAPVTEQEQKEAALGTFSKEELASFAIEEMAPEERRALAIHEGLGLFSSKDKEATVRSVYELYRVYANLMQKQLVSMDQIVNRVQELVSTGKNADGSPLTPRDLKDLHTITHELFKSGSEMGLRKLSYMVQETKTLQGKEGEGEQPAFTGALDKSAVPKELKIQDRDNIRKFIANLDLLKPGKHDYLLEDKKHGEEE